MFSDKDRSALADIERQLLTEDPQLARRLSSPVGQTRHAVRSPWTRWPATTFALSGLVPLIAILVLGPAPALVLFLGLAILAWSLAAK